MFAVSQSGGKKPLDHGVYDGWKALRQGALTRDGKWVGFGVFPQVGDGDLFVRSTSGETVYTIPRGTAQRFTYDGRFLLATVLPTKADTDKAKKEKKAPKDQPKNNLAILDTGTGTVVTIERVKSWRLADKGSEWLAYQLEDPPTPPAAKPESKPPLSEDSDLSDKSDRSELPGLLDLVRQAAQTQTQKPGEQKPAEQEPEDKPKKKTDHAPGSELILREISTGKETKLADVADYAFSEDGKTLLFAVSTKDGAGDAFVLMDLASGQKATLLAGLGRYQLLTIHNKSAKIAFVSDRDDNKSEKPASSLYVYERGWKDPKVVAKTGSAGITKDWVVVNRGALGFSESGKRLQFNVAPKPEPDVKDNTPEDEKVSLDIWNWKDAPLMPVQLLQAAQTRNRSYTAVAFLDSGKIVTLEDEELPNVNVGMKGDADVAIGATNKPYEVEASWNPGWNDVYLVDPRSGERKLFLKHFKGNASLSPKAKYALYYDGSQKAWFTYDVKSGAAVNLSKDIPYPVHDFDDDHPDLPGPIGAGGWIEDDKGIIIYDQFDAWLCDPTGKTKPVCITDGSGRFWSTTLRIIVTDREQDAHKMGGTLLLSGFNTRTKGSGFYRDVLGDRKLPEKLIYDDRMFSIGAKAENADVVTFTRQRFDEYGNLWLADTSFKNARQASDANPQMKDYNWCKSELVDWTSLDGIPLQGILVKPENFDPVKKYPMIVYFYERLSDGLNRCINPGPSSSTINPTMFASNGYLVFMPDIPYKVGYPGESAVNAILPGVTSLIARGFVDEKHMGIQGQSWGGYQVAYLVTRTNMFAAAGAGAAVSNMFSAYGGIRWGSGLVRQMQYEHGQSRIGGTPWDSTLRYIENSPIFWAEKVQTPVLLMNNDKDGAVPWYQGIEFFTALRRLEKPCWMLVYNNEDHNLTQRKNQKDLSVRLHQFFDHYLKGAPAPVWLEEGVPAVRKGKTMGLEVKGEKKEAGKAGG